VPQVKADDLYGIGMSKGLDSELMISSGQLYESQFNEHKYSVKIVEHDLDIAFLAYINVQKWQTVTLPESITTFTQLENALPQLAEHAGLNADSPFPFILRSKVHGLKWFIVDGTGNGMPDHLSSFLRSRYIGGLDDIDIEGMGFYSHAHRGIMSNPGNSMHIHFRTTKEPLFVGHIDNKMYLSKGAVILFPAIE